VHDRSVDINVRSSLPLELQVQVLPRNRSVFAPGGFRLIHAEGMTKYSACTPSRTTPKPGPLPDSIVRRKVGKQVSAWSKQCSSILMNASQARTGGYEPVSATFVGDRPVVHDWTDGQAPEVHFCGAGLTHE
jgi:hypothetical protein